MSAKKQSEKYKLQDALLERLDQSIVEFFGRPENAAKISSYEDEVDIVLGSLLTLYAERLADLAAGDTPIDPETYIGGAFDAVMKLYLQRLKEDSPTGATKKNNTDLH